MQTIRFLNVLVRRNQVTVADVFRDFGRPSFCFGSAALTGANAGTVFETTFPKGKGVWRTAWGRVRNLGP